MLSLLDFIKEHGDTIERYPGGFWRVKWGLKGWGTTSIEALVRERQPQYFSYADWLRLDELEIARGQAQGRPRVKFTSVEEMHTALGRQSRR